MEKRTQINVTVNAKRQPLYDRLLKAVDKPLAPSIATVVWRGIELALRELEKKN